MTVLDSRVTTEGNFQALSQALQGDMLETAIILRHALYDIHRMSNCLTGGLQGRLERALTTLDYPHFIPIENNYEAINECLEEIKELTKDYPMPSPIGWNLLAMGIDIAEHLRTRQDGE